MLDFAQVAARIDDFAQETDRRRTQETVALEEAVRRLSDCGSDWQKTQERIAASQTSWLVARWLEPPDAVYPAPEPPSLCTVYAADGSQIVTDRHDITSCYLINIGLIVLRYGMGERPTLTSRPHLALPDADLLDEIEGEEVAIAPRRLAIRRLLAEFEGLIELMEPASDTPCIALSDGSLILWPLETEKEEFRVASLKAFTDTLEAGRQKRVPIIGYISQPGSRDVLNSLRVLRCDKPEARCDRYCPNRSRARPDYVAPFCAGTEGITDADLFATRLQPGERSAVFGSDSKILKDYPAGHTIRFFYLHTGREIARIEIPDWVAKDPILLARTHVLCYDQAQKGDGYPVALAEAHEQAVVRGAERNAFFYLMEKAFVTARLPVAITQKSLAKRARRV